MNDGLTTLAELQDGLYLAQTNLGDLKNKIFFAKPSHWRDNLEEKLRRAEAYEAQLQRRIARMERENALRS